MLCHMLGTVCSRGARVACLEQLRVRGLSFGVVSHCMRCTPHTNMAASGREAKGRTVVRSIPELQSHFFLAPNLGKRNVRDLVAYTHTERGASSVCTSHRTAVRYSDLQ